jgi:predicted NAD/FAD-dependent oxidoreductase
MLAFEQSLELPFDGAFVHGSQLSWVARNDSKPGRVEDGETWILHASPEWSQEHMEDAPELVRELLTDAFWRATGIAGERAAYAVSHRWRYAIPPEPLADRCLFDAERRLGACGDWCGGPRVEGAFLSGVAIAERVLEHTKAAT